MRTLRGLRDMDTRTTTPAAQERTRTVAWDETDQYPRWLESRSGLGFVQALGDGRLPNPPIFALIGFRVAGAREGEVVARCEIGEHLDNAAAVVAGGVAATLIDTTAALAVRTCLPAGARMTTVDLKLNLLRALSGDSAAITATGTVVHRGRRICVAEGRVHTADGKLVAIGTSSLAIL